jgi:MFS family permease
MAVQIARDLELQPATVGTLTAVFFAAAACASITASRVVERVGAERGMRSAAIMSAVALVVGGASRSLAGIVAALVIGGVATAIATPSVHLLMSRNVALARQGFAFGVLRTATPAAGLLAGLAVPLIAITAGWRLAFLVAAGLAALATLAVGAGVRVRGGTLPRKGLAVGPRLPLAALALAMALGSGVVNALSSFFVASSVAFGISEGRAGMLLALGSVLGIAGRVAAGWLADRGNWEYLSGVAVLLLGGACGCAALAVGSPVSVYVGCALAFGLGWTWPGLLQVAVVSRYREAPAAATGFTQLGAYVGSVIGPVAFGLIVHASGYNAAWAATAGVAAFGAVISFGAARTNPGERRPATVPVPAITEVYNDG